MLHVMVSFKHSHWEMIVLHFWHCQVFVTSCLRSQDHEISLMQTGSNRAKSDRPTDDHCYCWWLYMYWLKKCPECVIEMMLSLYLDHFSYRSFECSQKCVSTICTVCLVIWQNVDGKAALFTQCISYETEMCFCAFKKKHIQCNGVIIKKYSF